MSKELFKRIDSVIRSERLYANVDLMREDVMRRFGISRHHLNDLLNQYIKPKCVHHFFGRIDVFAYFCIRL